MNTKEEFFKETKEDLSVDSWAENLLRFNTIKDKRNKERASLILKGFACAYTGVISEAFMFEKDRDGVYNFLEKDNREKNPISYEMIASSYSLDTLSKCLNYDTIIAVQDTTTLNYGGLHETEGLGYIGEKHMRGTLCHSTLAMNMEGFPLGILNLKLWCRDYAKYGQGHNSKKRAAEDKESFKWFESSRETTSLFNSVVSSKKVKVIHVSDRESDIYDLLQEIKESGNSCVIRSSINRLCVDDTGNTEKIRDAIRKNKPLGRIVIDVPQRKKDGLPEHAVLTLRSRKMMIIYIAKNKSEGEDKAKKRAPLTVNFVEAVEENPPEGAKALHWMLWTFEDVSTLEKVKLVIEIYRSRWTIEEYHKTAKSVMNVEKSQLKTEARIDIYLALCLPVALRIMQLKRLAENCPETPCTEIYTEAEWKSSCIFVNCKLPENGRIPDVLEVTTNIAKIGGYHGRKSDGVFGTITLGKGLLRLRYLSSGYSMALSDIKENSGFT